MKLKLRNALVVIFLISLIMIIFEEYNTLLVWWLTIFLLSPLVLVSFKLNYISPKIMATIIIFTQLVSAPFFFFDRENYDQGLIHPFNFDLNDSWPIILKVSFFLSIFLATFYLLSIIYKQNYVKEYKGLNTNLINCIHLNLKIDTKPQNYFNWLFYSVLIISVIIKIWMYSNAIGLTGVESPKLPFKLTGALFYSSMFFVPFLIFFFYWKMGAVNRGYFSVIFLTSYAVINGLTSLSKGAVLITALPAIFFAWYEKRPLQLTISVMGALFGVAMASAARFLVYYVDSDNKTAADVSQSVWSLFINTLNGNDINIYNINFILHTFLTIVDRIEGFKNLVFSNNYDLYAVTNPYEFLVNIILWPNYFNISADLHHIQWQGNILPSGFYNGGSLLSNVVILGNDNLFLLILFSVLTAFLLFLVEIYILTVMKKNSNNRVIAIIIVIFQTFWFFCSGGISYIYIHTLIAFIFLRYFQKIINTI